MTVRTGKAVAPEPMIEAFYEQTGLAWRVSAEYLRREQVLVNYATHSMICDHSVGLGGDGTGPSPGELLLSAIAACTAVYLGRHAARRGIPLETARVYTRLETSHEALDGPLSTLTYLSRVVKRVEVTGDLTEEQVADLRFIAENCAIGETLRRGLDLVEDLVHVPRTTTSPASTHLATDGPTTSSGTNEGDVSCCAVELDHGPAR